MSKSLNNCLRPHPHLYEINTMIWLYELSEKMNAPIRLGDVPDQEWDELQSKGFDCIWLMGIWERSPHSQNVAQNDLRLQREYDQALPGWTTSDVAGSPYAIRAYRPDSDIATWEELDSVLDKLHQRGMRLILDFVPNHTALDHDWVQTHPEYYIQGTTKNVEHAEHGFFKTELGNRTLYLAHGKDPYFPAWTDTAQLNYFHEDTRAAMTKELQSIAQHCDGVRCDMAMLVLNSIFQKTWSHCIGRLDPPTVEFWTEAVSALPESDFVWIAEVYWDLEWTLQQLGFHFTYDKRLYDRLCHSSPRDVSQHLRADMTYQNHLIRFLENHDEVRSATRFEDTHLLAVATLTATLPGMRLYHHGQLEGKRIQLPIQLRRVKEELPDLDAFEIYDLLLQLTNEEVFHEGQCRFLTMKTAGDSSFENLIGYQWRSLTAHKIVVVNLGADESQGFLYLDEIDEAENDLPSSFVYSDHLTGQEYASTYEDIVRYGLYVRLKPFDAHIFFLTTPNVDR